MKWLMFIIIGLAIGLAVVESNGETEKLEQQVKDAWSWFWNEKGK